MVFFSLREIIPTYAFWQPCEVAIFLFPYQSTMDIILVKASLVIHFPLRLWRILSPEPEFLASAALIPQMKHTLTAAFLGKAVLFVLT